MSRFPMAPEWVSQRLHEGLVIPAHPLALTLERKLDERRQRTLTRYYHAAGAGGLAVGVHTTQFAIRDPAHGLFEPVLQAAAETVAACDAASGRRTVLVAGVCGETQQAVREARFAAATGYQAGLISLADLKETEESRLLSHCEAVAQEIALFGFYLQPAVGGRILPLSFWRQFVLIPNLVAIKIAPFNRYQTLDVIRAVVESGRAHQVALYTGNDDHIILDLLSEYVLPTARGVEGVNMVGGLLGQWAYGTRRAVAHLETCKQAREKDCIPPGLLTLANQLTDFNAALFDAAHGFAGCIAGIQEALYRQGLLANGLCLDPQEKLSAGQAEEIDRVCGAYPHLTDDDFVANHLAEWL
ncbi:MAG: dihydrodipicolinate synthase family protein [Gemmataceae bacterium]